MNELSGYYLRHIIPLNHRKVSGEVLKISKIYTAGTQQEKSLGTRKESVRQIMTLTANPIMPE